MSQCLNKVVEEEVDAANTKAEQGVAPVYNYVFAMEFPTMGGWLSWHYSEIPYVFYNPDIVVLPYGCHLTQNKSSLTSCVMHGYLLQELAIQTMKV